MKNNINPSQVICQANAELSVRYGEKSFFPHRHSTNLEPGSPNKLILLFQVLRLASVGGRPCPGPSVQYSTCNYPCDSFQWVTSGWSECNLIDKRKSCGKGRKTRAIRLVKLSTFSFKSRQSFLVTGRHQLKTALFVKDTSLGGYSPGLSNLYLGPRILPCLHGTLSRRRNSRGWG